MFGSCRSNDPCDSAVPSIVDVVPLGLEKLGCRLHSTVDDTVGGRVKVLGE